MRRRRGLAIGLGLAALALAAAAAVLLRPAEVPTLSIPDPNGFDDLLLAALVPSYLPGTFTSTLAR